MAKKMGLGWVRDSLDRRDLKYTPAIHAFAALPPAWDLRDKFPSSYNQGSIGSCTAQALGSLIHYREIQDQKTLDVPIPSRLFIYYNERVLEGTVKEDAGAQIRDGIKALIKWGCCSEKYWPYKENKFTKKPSKTAFKAAQSIKIQNYFRVNQDLDSIKLCIHEGNPVVFGFAVYESFEGEDVANTGIMPMPKMEETLVGGHAVIIVGWSDEKQCVIVRNSWGADWGDKGAFYMPYEFLLDPQLCSDFWTIKFVEGKLKLSV